MADKTTRISAEQWRRIVSSNAGTMPSLGCVKGTEPRQRRKPAYREEKLQIACVEWFDKAFPCYSCLLFHPANGGKRTAREAVIFRSMGVRAGIPDFFLLLPRQGHTFLAIEMKYGKGKQSDNQKRIEEAIGKYSGGKYVVCRSLDEFRDMVCNYIHD